MNHITPINIPFPQEDVLHLRLTVGACRVRITPGDGPDWVTGSYSDPANVMALRITQEGGTLRIGQEFHWEESSHFVNEPPTFEVTLGKGRPFSLTLEGGASESLIDLGGLPLRGLDVKYGAGRQMIDFSAPNPQKIEKFGLTAGAASVETTHLTNANFDRLVVEGGAARFALDFGGEMVRDSEVRINAGMASVELMVPPSIAARVQTETVLGGLDVGDGWMKRDGLFMNERALAGGEPCLTINAHVAMGAIRLVTA